MSARHASLAVLLVTCLLSAGLVAQELTVPDVANEKHQFVGEVTANNVYVRSGPSDNYYPTIKLDKGAQVTVVGQKFEWLKIVPPEGSFSYVAKVHVSRRGDGSVGRVDKADLLVKAGSTLNAMKTAVQTKLDENTDVTILGEQDEYFKIKPPAGAYLYVHRQFVTPVKKVGEARPADRAAAPLPDVREPVAQNPTEAPAEAAAPATQPTPGAEAAAPSTQPAGETAVAAEAEFDQVESDFLTTSKQPLDQRPVAALLERYQKLAKNTDLPGSMRRIADHRARTLQIQLDAQADLLKARKADEDARQRAVALQAERDELEQRIKANQVQVFTAVGTLRPSSLQGGRDTLYRLTDPNTGRTLVYVRTNDAKIAGLIGQFVGVRGELANDAQMNIRVITPTGAEAVEMTQVTTKVAAQIMPPSLLPKTSASAGE